ncbi:MAG TPA: TetR/AcrR family transcriptional regulator [Acidimicrobiales bacterium]|nr:TetR/AcrR family transcriptional regulator [Acidimicrobiales bacterium]
MASQEERKAETRRRLLDAAALLFAERGIDAVSIDAVAEEADRTSGAVYAHFGSKDGLLAALLDELVNDMAAIMSAELTLTSDGDEQLGALWRTFADPPPGPGRGWMLLEHEFWLYAARHEEARRRLAHRFELARQSVAEAMTEYADAGAVELPAAPDQVGTLLVALLLGLEMQHRIDPDSVLDATAVTGLRAVTGFRQIEPGRVARPKPWPVGQHDSTSDPTNGPTTELANDPTNDPPTERSHP